LPDERALSSLLFEYPQIVRGYLLQKRVPVLELEGYRREDVCPSGRADLLFREKSGDRLIIVELQLGLADRDHYERLVEYVNDYSSQQPPLTVIGLHFAQRFPADFPRFRPPLYRVRFSPDSVMRRAERIEAQEERLLGLSCPKPPADAFARLSYLNGFLAFVASRPFVTYGQVVQNVAGIAKNPRQVRNPEYRARLWIRFAESFGLVERFDARIVLTALGRAYASLIERRYLWGLSAEQKRLLIAGLLAARCTNGHKFGIFCILRAVQQEEEVLDTGPEWLEERFVALCSRQREWARVSQRASFGWYRSYAEEMGLCQKSGAAQPRIVLTTTGREVLAVLSRQYAAFEMERRLVLRTAKRLL